MATRLNPLDLYDVRAQLSDEERMVQDTLRVYQRVALHPHHEDQEA